MAGKCSHRGGIKSFSCWCGQGQSLSQFARVSAQNEELSVSEEQSCSGR